MNTEKHWSRGGKQSVKNGTQESLLDTETRERERGRMNIRTTFNNGKEEWHKREMAEKGRPEGKTTNNER
jgi:hypothetical protein